MRVLVIGGGCWGSVAAAELAHRGHTVTLVDRVRTDDGALKNNGIAATNDDNKLIRIDYGADAVYTDLCALAIAPGTGGAVKCWTQWPSDAFHQSGLLLLDNKPIESDANSFASQSLQTLKARGYRFERKPAARLRVFDTRRWCDSYLQPDGGWTDCGQAVRDTLALCESLGVKILDDYVAELLASTCGTRVVGARMTSGARFTDFDEVVVAAGARTAQVLPHLASFIKPLAQVVVHFAIDADHEALRAMPAWAASIRETGFYGFPLHPRTNMCKVGYHGPGYPLPIHAANQATLASLLIEVRDREERRFREFMKELVPSIAVSRRVEARVCLYEDSNDSDFVIDRDVRFANVVVASGGSGHGFKFMPVLGVMIANCVDRSKPAPNLIDATKRFGDLKRRMSQQLKQVDSCRAVNDAEAEERAACVERALRRVERAKL